LSRPYLTCLPMRTGRPPRHTRAIPSPIDGAGKQSFPRSRHVMDFGRFNGAARFR
jgi:hypothetical protein